MASNSNLFSFPPNNINYPYKNEDTNNMPMPMATVNSYSAPPSGPLQNSQHSTEQTKVHSYNNSPYFYSPPVTLDYLPPSNEENDNIKDSYTNMQLQDQESLSDDEDKTDDDSLGVLPASAMDMAPDHHSMTDQMANNDMPPNTMDSLDNG